MPQALAEIDGARARGVDVAADMYPYPAGGTGLSITVPNWVFEEGEEQGWARLREPAVRERLKREVAAGSEPGWSNLVQASGGWDHVVLANAFNPKYDAYRDEELGRDRRRARPRPGGRRLGHRARGPAGARDGAVLHDGRARHRDARCASRGPASAATPAAAAKFGEVDALGLPHPRAYGTFPRVIAEYVRKRHVLTLEEAVRKMTSWPATRMGLFDRGVIREGMRADLTVFDYERLQDNATWQQPTAAASGIDYVVVNGQVTVDAGRYTGAKAGRVLRGGCARDPGTRPDSETK